MKPGDVGVDFSSGLINWHDGIRVRALNPGGTVFVDARDYGVIAGAGDMTSQIQTALDNSDIGATLVFQPGTYTISGFLTVSQSIHIYGYGAIFDWGTTTFTNADTAFLFGSSAGSTRARYVTVAGLTVQRTAADLTIGARLGNGFRWRSLQECTVTDVTAKNFYRGHWITGSYNATDGEVGNVHNVYTNLNTQNSRFALFLDPGDSTAGPNSGWCNQNTFIGGRLQTAMTGSVASGDPAIANSSAAIVLWKEANSGHDCNTNTFIGTSVEGTNWGRKVYGVGCRYTTLINCRFEFHRGGQVNGIYYYESAAASPPYWKFNPVTGVQTQIAVDAGSNPIADVEIVEMPAGVAGDHTMIIDGYDVSSAAMACMWPHKFNTLTSNVEEESIRKVLRCQHLRVGYRTGDSGGGTEYSSQSIFRGSGVTPPLALYNATGGFNPALNVEHSDRKVRFSLKAGIVSGSLGGIEFYNTSEALINAIYVLNAALGGEIPFAVQRGLWVNSGTTHGTPLDADSRISSLNDVNCFYLDASTDRIGIGGNVPLEKLHVFGNARIGAVFLVAPSGNNAALSNPTSGGRLDYNVGLGGFNLYSANGAANDLIRLMESNNIAARMILKAGSTSWGGNNLAGIEFFNSTPALENVIFLHNVVLPVNRPVAIANGLWVNRNQTNNDTRISGQTDIDLLYGDASTDRIGVGTNTPDSKLHCSDKIHAGGEMEIDGDLNHDGTNVGFYGTAPGAKPTITGSRGGNAALASLLTALAGLGLITDSTTA